MSRGVDPITKARKRSKDGTIPEDKMNKILKQANVRVPPEELRDGDPKNIAPEGAVGPHIIRHADGRLRNLAICPLSGKMRIKGIPIGYDENGIEIYAYNSNGEPICGARSVHKPNNICQNRQRLSTGRCQTHTDKLTTMTGEQHPKYTEGKYTRTLPKKTVTDYEKLLKDPDYLNLRSNIALTDLTIAEALKNISEDDFTPETWDKLQKTRDKMERFCMGDRPIDKQSAIEKAVSIMSEACILMEHGGQKSKAWDRVTEISLKRAKLVEIQARRLREEKHNIPADHAYRLFGDIITIVKENVRDKVVLRNIAMSIDRLSKDPANRVALGGTIDTAAMETQSTIADEIRDRDE